MSRARQIASRLLLAAWAANAIAAFASLQRAGAAWLLVGACAIAAALQLPAATDRVRNTARYGAWAVLAGTLVLGIIFMAYPVLQATTARQLTLLAGYSVAAFAVLFLAGTRTWTLAHDLAPASFGVLVVGCFSTARGAALFAAVAGIIVAAWLIVQRPPATLRPGVCLRSAVFLLAFAGTAAAIIRALPAAQDQVEKAMAEFAAPQDALYRSFTSDAALGDLEELKLSSRLVMRVWTERPQKLRASVFATFDGRRWRARSSGAGRRLPPAAGSLALQDVPGTAFNACDSNCAPAASRSLNTRIVQKAFAGPLLVAPGGTRLLRVPADAVSIKPFRIFETASPGGIGIYGTVNDREQDVVEAATRDAVPEIFLRAGTDEPRIRDLATRLSTDAATDAEKLRRTIDFLQSQYHYSLKPGKFHSNQPLAEFLFEKKVGYCEYFASAAAVLLRMQGVPTRYVTGFNVGPANRKGDHYVVRQKDAHAWIEAYIEGRGWVEAEPTPASEYEAATADVGGSRLGELLESLQARAAAWWARARVEGWKGAAVMLLYALTMAAAVLATLAAARRLRQPRRATAQAPPLPADAEVRELLRALDAVWQRQGFPRPASRAPLEHALSLPPGKSPPECLAAIDCIYRACFAGASVSRDEFTRASATLRSLR